MNRREFAGKLLAYHKGKGGGCVARCCVWQYNAPAKMNLERVVEN